MSHQASEWASQRRTGSATRKLVLLLLADKADEAHSCYPGLAWLAERGELSERAVRQAITTLVEDGFLRVLRRGAAGRRGGGRRSNRYQLLLHGAETPLPPTGDWASEYDPETARAEAAARKSKAAGAAGTHKRTDPSGRSVIVVRARPGRGRHHGRHRRRRRRGPPARGRPRPSPPAPVAVRVRAQHGHHPRQPA